MGDRIPILLDTDPGNDADDVVALSLLAKEPRCELLGVGVVSRGVAERAALVEATLADAGLAGIPIHLGESEPMSGPGQDPPPQYAVVADSHTPHPWPEESAVDALATLLRERPGEITVLSIGPPTNLGRLVERHPDILLLAKEVVAMIGRYDGHPHPEWNALCDPAATRLFLEAPSAPRRLFGYDVTERTKLAPEVFRDLMPPSLRTARASAELFMAHAGHLILHDPLAAYAVFDPGVCEYAGGRITVAPDGRTLFAPGDGPDRVATSVDLDRLLAGLRAVYHSR